jgi:hypothetical protein
MTRVVKPGGYLVHVVPSASWRFWTSVAYYPEQLRKVIRSMRRRARASAAQSAAGDVRVSPSPRARGKMSLLLPPRHGEHASALGELFTFRRRAWLRLLDRPELELVSGTPHHLFYSGGTILGRAIGFRMRERLSRILGSACHIFILRKRST